MYIFSDLSKLLNSNKRDINTCIFVYTTLYVFAVLIREFILMQYAMMLQGSVSGTNSTIDKFTLNQATKITL